MKKIILLMAFINGFMVMYGQLSNCSCTIQYTATPSIRQKIVLNDRSILNTSILNNTLFSDDSKNHIFSKDSFIIKDSHVYIHKNDTNFEIFNYTNFINKDTFYYVLASLSASNLHTVVYLVPDTIFKIKDFLIFRYRVDEEGVNLPTKHISDSLIRSHDINTGDRTIYYDYNPALGFINKMYDSNEPASRIMTIIYKKKFIKKAKKLLKCSECW